MGNKKSLVVGLSNFPEEPLPGAKNDVRLWCDLLERVGFCPTPLLNPTKHQILDALREILKTLGNYLFVYAGHGTVLQDDQAGIVAGIVAMPKNHDDHDFVISKRELDLILNSAKPYSTVTAIFDCCYAAGLSAPNRGVYDILDEVVPEQLRSRFLQLPGVPLPQGRDQRATLRTAEFANAGVPGRLDIDATSLDLDARERPGLDGTDDSYGIFSLYATRVLTESPALTATKLRAAIAADVRAASDGQEVTVPTTNGREKDPFLTI